MENNYSNIVGIKFAQAEQPKFTENKGKGYIEFGKENNYPNYLMDLYNESPKHGSIIKGKALYIYGKGFEGVTKDANTQGESWNEIMKKCILDDELYGGYYLQIIYNLLGVVKDVYHLENHKVRTNKKRSNFWVKDDWSDNKEKAREYPAFNSSEKTGSQILFIKQYNPKSQVYALPYYFQGLNYIESDVQVSRHILGNAKEGFVATTLINLNGGEPQEEQKAAVEKGLKKKFTGSEGDRVVIMFNKSKDNAAEILPLGSTMLTKEDFTNINGLIQQEIYAAHSITSPMLFGIKTEGQLGGRSEIRDAYEIFNNTYINSRQQAIEEIFNGLMRYAGIQGQYKIIPVEPLGFEFGEMIQSQNLSKDEIREMMGKQPLDPSIKTQAQIISDNINALSPLVANKVLESMTSDEIRSLAGLVPTVNGTTVVGDGSMPTPPPAVNSNLASMTGRQFQQLERIKRKFEAGKLTREQAAMMLKNSFGINDEEVSLFLDAAPEQQFSDQELDQILLSELAIEGEDVNLFEVISRKPARESEYFADIKQLDQLESNVLDLIRKDKLVTPEVIAETLKIDLAVVNKAIESLTALNVLKTVQKKSKGETVIERTATSETIRKPKPETSSILLRYTYAWRDIVPASERNTPSHPSRDFCVKMMELSATKVWSRQDIERISERMGYSVFNRVGGWWTSPDNPTPYQCRHEWQAITVIRKNK